MNQIDHEAIVSRIEARLTQGGRNATGDGLQRSLERMVNAGADRFGLRADRPQPQGMDACELAPPIARMIDHTALKAETSEAQIRELCEEARRYCFATVCINPSYVPLAASMLGGSSSKVCTVIGFPLGATMSAAKAREAELATAAGAQELDMVINVGFLKSERYEEVEADIRGVVTAGRKKPGTVVKVIIETALLTDREKVIACVLAQNAEADFVKTSTGFSTSGATADDIALMRRVVGKGMGVKASGGVRSLQDAEQMVASGATRIGASASVAIVRGLRGTSDY